MMRELRWRHLWVAAICSLSGLLLVSGFAQQAFADAPEDEKTLQGTWTAVKAELAGRPLTEAELGVVTLTLENGNYAVTVNGKLDQGTCKVDAAAQPGKMTISGGKEGPNAGKTFLAIYEIAGDTLRVCYDLSGKKSPEAFATQKGTPLYLVTYQRKK